MTIENIILDKLGDPIIVVNSKCTIEYTNNAAIKKLGAGDELKGSKCHVQIWKDEEACAYCPFKNNIKRDFYVEEILDKERNIYWEVAISLIRDDANVPEKVVARFRNINKQKRYERELDSEGEIDPLTGMFTREVFTKNLEKEFSRASRQSSEVAIYMLQVDDFSQYRAQHGQDAADGLIAKIGHYLTSSIRVYDSAYRYSTDIFSVILPDTKEKGARIVAKRIKKELQKLWDITLSVSYVASNDVVIFGKLIERAERGLRLIRDGGGDDIRLGP